MVSTRQKTVDRQRSPRGGRISARQNARLKERLVLLCRERGLSVRSLAARAGVSIGAVRGFGRSPFGPTLGTLLALAEALDLKSIDELLGPSGSSLLRHLPRLEREAGQAPMTVVMGCDTTAPRVTPTPPEN